MSKEMFSLITWFRERRASVIVEKISNHIGKVIDTCNEFMNAMINLTEDSNSLEINKEAAESAFKRVIIQERSADHIKQELFKEISKVKLDAKNREDLFKLIYQIDPIANWVKVAAKNSLILIELNMEFPHDMWTRFRTIGEMILSSARLLKKMVENLGINDDSILLIRTEIETLEQSADDLYFTTKKFILSSKLSAQATILLMDLLEGLENSSDHCAGTADIMYILVMASR